MTSKITAFHNVNVGQEIPSLTAGPIGLQDLAEWCGAEEDYLAIHYDQAAAKAAGLPGCVVQGTFKCALLGKMVTDWLGESGTLRKIQTSYRGMDFPGDTITCRGVVTGKHTGGKEQYFELELWTENQRGEKTTLGSAMVSIP